ncbi:P-loop containing nucleoside triphosphate hydrolase protein [Venturia nashicola]|uniref:RNA helicase n=1 Tax=Venturia nashicola TaxID=86259 RepID=A0A4Z1NVV3_9PEZI|nr:P-loop containing nucleoside triphosphate hydrolase protein [Venturia nashicola]
MAPKFVPRERKHRKIARQKDTNRPSAQHEVESNEHEILPKSRDDIEVRKRSMREELRAAQPKMSSKKQKRLDKYIDTKLRKDERLALIKRLEERQSKTDTSLFQSTKKLGQRTETKKEALQRALELKRRGLGGEEEDELLFERPDKRARASSDWGASDESEEDEKPIQAASIHPTVKVASATTVGAGLKTALQLGEDGKPIIKSRKRRKVEVKFDLQPTVAEEWTGMSDGSQSEMSSNTEEGDEDEEIDDSSDEESLPESEGPDDAEYSGEDDNSNSDDDDDSDSSQSDASAKKKTRASAFKIWAEQARNDAIGFTPSTVIGDVPLQPHVSDEVRKSFVARPLDQEPLPEGFIAKATIDRKVHAVPVERSEEIQTTRLQLPILTEEQAIMECIFNNDVVVLSGSTGSGKTTQIPQFLYEGGFSDPHGPTPGMIGITQPRRVAAMSSAKRVAHEMGKDGKKVSYQIRFDSTVGKQTRIKFMTDGVLLREMSEDFSLRKYSTIVIDEAHERTVNTDILISLMSRCVKARRQLAKEKPELYSPLKLIIMSATLRVSDFRENSRLFSTPPPLLDVAGRQFPVTTHWSRKTSQDWGEEAFKKITRGHRKLPPGGFLVFLTGAQEIRTLTKRLMDTFQSTDSGPKHQTPVEDEDMKTWDTEDQAADFDEDESDESEPEDPDAEFVIDGEVAEDEIMGVHVLPLYSQLPSKEQQRVFEPPPKGTRLIILATDVAETSLTIPGIRYVFDSGRHKQRSWDRCGVESYKTTWVSKASADQRMGRAGRTGPGHCYSAVFESFAQFSEPEIYRCPLESVVLQLKQLQISRIDNFPFPTPPERSSLIKAETLLRHLGAIKTTGQITELGKQLQNYPVSPRFAQMLRLGVLYDCTAYAVMMVAALDIAEIIIPEGSLDLRTPVRDEDSVWTAAESQAETLRQSRRQAYNAAQASLSRLDFNTSKVTAQADCIKLFAALYEFSNSSDQEQCCRDNFLREKGVREAMQLREQLTHIVRNLNPTSAVEPYQAQLTKPTEKQIRLLKQIVAAGFIDQVAIRADCLPIPPEMERKPKRAIDVRYKTLLSSTDPGRPKDPSEPDTFVYIHPSSILARLPATQVPRYIIYQRLQKSQPSAPGKKARVRLHPLTPVTAEQLSVLARGTSLLQVGKPLGKIGVLTSVGGEERRECLVQINLVGEGGGMGWPLVTRKVVQKRVPNEGWVVEKWVD